MQQGFTPSFKTKILQYFFNCADQEISSIFPCQLYLGLFIDQGSAEPQELVIGKNNYSRARIDFITAQDSGVVRNSNAVAFPKAEGGDWTYGSAKITNVGIFTSHIEYDEETGESYVVSDINDEPIAFLQLPEAESVLEGETFQFNANSITLQLI